MNAWSKFWEEKLSFEKLANGSSFVLEVEDANGSVEELANGSFEEFENGSFEELAKGSSFVSDVEANGSFEEVANGSSWVPFVIWSSNPICSSEKGSFENSSSKSSNPVESTFVAVPRSASKSAKGSDEFDKGDFWVCLGWVSLIFWKGTDSKPSNSSPKTEFLFASESKSSKGFFEVLEVEVWKSANGSLEEVISLFEENGSLAEENGSSAR